MVVKTMERAAGFDLGEAATFEPAQSYEVVYGEGHDERRTK